MIKEKSSPKDWKINDVFYTKIKHKDELYNNKYLLFIKVGEYQWSKNSKIPVFWLKITKDNNLPETKEEIDNLEFIITSMTVWEERFFPLMGDYQEMIKDLEEKKKVKFFPDDFGYLHEYRFALIAFNRKYVPEELEYLGNFEVTPPKDEYIPFSELSINAYRWENLFDNLLERYKLYNLRQSIMYEKEYSENLHKQNKEVFDMQVNLTKYDYFCKEKYNMGYFEFIDKQRTQAKLKNMSKEAKDALKDLTAIAQKYEDLEDE